MWVDAGVAVKRGDIVRLSAGGSWSNIGPPALGPAGFANYRYPGTIVSSADLASLVGKIGETGFAIGEQKTVTGIEDGRLFLSINDTPGTFGDNQGAVNVTISIIPGPPAPLLDLCRDRSGPETNREAVGRRPPRPPWSHAQRRRNNPPRM